MIDGMTPKVATLVTGEAERRVAPAAITDDKARDLRDIWRVLWRFRMTVVVTVAICISITAAVLWYMTPMYMGTSVVMFAPQRPVIVDVEAFVSRSPLELETVAGQVAILESNTLAERVVRTLRLYEDPEFNADLRGPSIWERAWSTIFPGGIDSSEGASESEGLSPEENFRFNRVQIVNRFLDNVEILPREGTHVIDVSFVSADPGTAAAGANAIAEVYLDEQREAKFDETKREAAWLNERLVRLREELEASEARVEEFRREAGLLRGGEQVSLTHQQIAELNTELITARTRTAELEARLKSLEGLAASPDGILTSAEVLTSDAVRDLTGQETEILRQISELSTQLGAEHPMMITKRRELQDLRVKIETEIQKVVANLRNEVAVARAQEQALEESLVQMKVRIADLDAADARLRILTREAETASFLYDTFLAKFKESQGFQDFQGADARIIQRAEVPIVPAYPKKTIILALASIAGGFVGLFVAFLREQFDPGFHSMEQIERHLGVATLGLVPSVKTWRQGPEELILTNPGSAFGESLRAIHTGLVLSNVDHPPRVVVITSCKPKEGKTTIALCLARRLAATGTRVMLLDADLRKAEVHRKVGGKADPGLAEYLTGKASLEDAIQTDEKSGMKFIAAGKSGAQSADLLGSRRMKDLLLQLASQYEMVILDAPPTLAVADARLLCNLADKTLLVVRWGTTRREAAALGARQIVESGGDLAGVVLSMVDIKRNAALGYGDSELYTASYRRYYAS